MLDKIDYAILAELFKDSRVPFTTIAEKLGVSPGTVKNRFKRMQDTKTIGICSADIDLAKFGYQCKVFLMLKVAKKEDTSAMLDKISCIPNVIATSGIIGDFDFFTLAVAKDVKHLDKILKDIRTAGIEQIEVALSIRDIIPLLPDKP